MNRITNLPSTSEFQQMDAAHHIHPFSDMAELNQTGSRVIVKGDGIFLYDNDHHQDKDWVPKKITNDTALINIWQPQEQKNALFGPEMSETHLLHPLHFSWEQSLPSVTNGHHSILFQMMMGLVTGL